MMNYTSNKVLNRRVCKAYTAVVSCLTSEFLYGLVRCILILQRLFKVVQEKQVVNPNTANKKDSAVEKEIVSSNHEKAQRKPKKRERIDLDCKDLNKHLASLLQRDNIKSCFSKTLYIYKVKLKKDEIIRGLARSSHNRAGYADQPSSSSPTTTHNVGKKVLPVNDTSKTSSTRRRKKTDNEGDDKPTAISKMKELMRWSATAKSLKGGKQNGIKDSHFRNKGIARGLPSGDDFTSDSPKISLSLNPDTAVRNGNWITTDNEFVVLEL